MRRNNETLFAMRERRLRRGRTWREDGGNWVLFAKFLGGSVATARFNAREDGSRRFPTVLRCRRPASTASALHIDNASGPPKEAPKTKITASTIRGKNKDRSAESTMGEKPDRRRKLRLLRKRSTTTTHEVKLLSPSRASSEMCGYSVKPAIALCLSFITRIWREKHRRA